MTVTFEIVSVMAGHEYRRLKLIQGLMAGTIDPLMLVILVEYASGPIDKWNNLLPVIFKVGIAVYCFLLSLMRIAM